MIDFDYKKLKKEIWSKASFSVGIVLVIFLAAFLIAILGTGFGLLFFSISAVSIIIGLIIFLSITKKLRMDLISGKVKTVDRVLKDKCYRIDYEPGSATMPVTILSFLSLKIFNREMKQIDIYMAITEEEQFDITKDEFERIEIGEKIIIRRGYYSDLYLGIEKNNYA
jgi:hypothetical protein